VNEETQITVLSDGDAGLRTVQWEVAPKSEHVLDWFHIGMRFEHLFDACQAIRNVPMAAHVSAWAHQLATRAKWALMEWPSGQDDRSPGSGARLDRIRARGDTRNPKAGAVRYRPTALSERQREGNPSSTAWVESAINEIIAKRMAKSQQMRWNRWTVQPFLAVRIAVLNDSLADSFRDWFPGFRPVDPKVPEPVAA
jgi:hypothetical protein